MKMKKSELPGPTLSEFLGSFKAFFERTFVEKITLRHGRPWEWGGKFPLELERTLLPLIPEKEEVTNETIRARQSRIVEGGLDLDALIAEVFWYAENKPTDPEYCASLGYACGLMIGTMLSSEEKAIFHHRRTGKSKIGTDKRKTLRERLVIEAYLDEVKEKGRERLECLSKKDFIENIRQRVGPVKAKKMKTKKDALVLLSTDTIERYWLRRDKEKYPPYPWETKLGRKRNICDKTPQT
jgi:hypothetical protein